MASLLAHWIPEGEKVSNGTYFVPIAIIDEDNVTDFEVARTLNFGGRDGIRTHDLVIANGGENLR